MAKKLKQKKISVPQADGSVKRISVYYKTIEELERKTFELLNSVEKELSFEKVAELWFEVHSKEISPYTEQCYIAPLKDCEDEFGEMSITEITAEAVHNFIVKLTKKKFARQTIKLRLTVLAQVFDYAIIKGYIKYNPTTAVKIPTSAGKKERVLPSTTDIKKIKEAVTDEFGLIPYIALYTGMRKGEILALQWQDINFENKTISVNKTIVYVDGLPVVKDTPKSVAGIRKVPLLKPLEDELVKIKKSTGFIINIGGRTPTRSEYHCMEKKYKRVHGVTLCLHQLRHEFATMCYDAGLDIKEAQKLLGHSKESVTADIYTHIRSNRLSMAQEKLQSYIVS